MHPRILIARALIALALVLPTACVNTTPSSGRCTGTIDGRPVDLPMDAAASYFYRDDDILGDEDGPFVMAYGAGALTVSGQFDDLPSSRELGTRPVPQDDIVDRWEVRSTLSGGNAQGSTLTLTTSSRERVVGSFTTRFAEGSVTCTLDLRRAYERDTDD